VLATAGAEIYFNQFSAGGFGDIGLQWRNVHVAGPVSLVHNTLSVDVTGENTGPINISNVVYNSGTLTGRHLDRLHARAGQFFGLRFLTPRLLWQLHPFSLSEAPDGQSLRITIKISGDFTRAISTITPGTRVLAEGPFGHLTDAVRRRPGVALIAGGIGVTPLRALLEEMPGDIVLLYRVTREEEVLFRDEFAASVRLIAPATTQIAVPAMSITPAVDGGAASSCHTFMADSRLPSARAAPISTDDRLLFVG